MQLGGVKHARHKSYLSRPHGGERATVLPSCHRMSEHRSFCGMPVLHHVCTAVHDYTGGRLVVVLRLEAPRRHRGRWGMQLACVLGRGAQARCRTCQQQVVPCSATWWGMWLEQGSFCGRRVLHHACPTLSDTHEGGW